MAGKFHHEQLYRGADLLAKLAALRITLCGAGAVGSNLADNLVRQGLTHLRVIDHDRVEEHNVSTQLYGESEVGTWKVERKKKAATLVLEPFGKLAGKTLKELERDGEALLRFVEEDAPETGIRWET